MALKERCNGCSNSDESADKSDKGIREMPLSLASLHRRSAIQAILFFFFATSCWTI